MSNGVYANYKKLIVFEVIFHDSNQSSDKKLKKIYETFFYFGHNIYFYILYFTIFILFMS